MTSIDHQNIILNSLCSTDHHLTIVSDPKVFNQLIRLIPESDLRTAQLLSTLAYKLLPRNPIVINTSIPFMGRSTQNSTKNSYKKEFSSFVKGCFYS